MLVYTLVRTCYYYSAKGHNIKTEQLLMIFHDTHRLRHCLTLIIEAHICSRL